MGGKAERSREGQPEPRPGIVPKRLRKELGIVAATNSEVRTVADLFTRVYSVSSVARQEQPSSSVRV